MIFFTPRYLKNARILHKGVTRFLNYKRDILPAERLQEIESLKRELEDAIKARDVKRLGEMHGILNKACDRALPNAKSSDISENVEVFFVSIVIALGIRAYIAQPFQIPTSSMQPTLNGIRAQETEKDPRMGTFETVKGWFTGTTYLNAVSDHDGYLRKHQPLTEHRFLIFRPYSRLHFEDGHSIKINAPNAQLMNNLHLAENVKSGLIDLGNATPDRRQSYGLQGGERVRKGQLLARGIVTNGDYVVVNKFAYHFRKPTRGEVFVFTTKSIGYIENERDASGMLRMNPGSGSQHYIKRLVGVPGDKLELDPPGLLINDKPPVEPGIRKVIDEAIPLIPGVDQYAYHGYTGRHEIPFPVVLQKNPERQTYFAMGDNSAFSSDSRYFGPVPEQNLVGPGWFCYWPLTSHWGWIR